jgi:LysR family glycine cleavage system transcriptional activator
LFGKTPHKQVTLRCTSSVATLWIAPEIRAFQARFPEIDLHIITQEQDVSMGQANPADIEIYTAENDDQGADVTPLLTTAIVPVAALSYLEGRAHGRPSDIVDLDLIHITGYRDDWHRWFHTFGVSNDLIPRGLTVDSSLFAIDAALRGDGIFLGRRPFLDSHLKTGELVEVFDKPYNLQAKYFLRRQAAAKNRTNQQKVCDWLVALAART